MQYGKCLVDLAFNETDNGVTAFFSDGTTVHGTILIGGDGPRSKVREFAMGSAEAATVKTFPIWHHNLTVCYGDAEKARYLRRRFPTSYLALSDRSFHAFQSSESYVLIVNHSMLDVCLRRQKVSRMPDGPDHPESWIFHLAMAWNGNPDHSLGYAERLALIKERAKSLGEPAHSAFQWIPDDTLVHRADISYWITQPWNNRNGRLTLVGDAAHPMPPCQYDYLLLEKGESVLTQMPDRGQGLNHCICDISHLLDTLRQTKNDGQTLEKGIAAYEEELVTRGSEEVKCSLENGTMLHDWEKVMQSPVFTNGFRPMKGHDTYGNSVKTGDNLESRDEAKSEGQKAKGEAQRIELSVH